ncbi:hypothetical protein QQ045_018805 [Rhodiola kirilowii]
MADICTTDTHLGGTSMQQTLEDGVKGTLAEIVPTRLFPTPKATPALNSFSELTSTLAEESQMREMEKQSKGAQPKKVSEVEVALNVHAKAFVPTPKALKGHVFVQNYDHALATPTLPSDEVTTHKGPSNVQNNTNNDVEKMKKIKKDYNSLFPDPILTKEDLIRMKSTRKNLPPLTMYSRGMDVGNCIYEEEDSHYCRWTNPYID